MTVLGLGCIIVLSGCITSIAGLRIKNVCELSESGEVIPIENDCYHYWFCLEGITYKIPCSENTEFSPTLRRCVKKESSDCTRKVPNDPLQAACVNKPTGALVPHPSDCTKFLVCDYINPTVQNCSPGLHFNAKKKVCDWPRDAGCEVDPHTTVRTTEITTYTPTLPTTVPEPNTCTAEPEGSRHPYPSNCSAYIRCENGWPNLLYCPPDKLFNPSMLICDTPESFSCTEETLPSTNICENESIGTKVPYPDNCKKYIACDFPAPIAYFCCDNLDFNAELKICEAPENAGCGVSSTTEPITITTLSTTKTTTAPEKWVCHDKPEGSFVPYPENCLKYIVCSKPIPTADYCPNNLFFNERLQICDIPKDSGCSDEVEVSSTTPLSTTTSMATTHVTDPEYSNICSNEAINTSVPHPDDCSKYVICSYPIPEVRGCLDGLHFNAVTKKCDTIENANCIDITSTIETTRTTATEPADTTTSEPTDTTTLKPTDTTATEETTTVTSNECANKPNGAILPYDEDCSKYILCTDNDPVVVPCTKGHLFNPKTNQCDIPEDLGCPDVSATLSPTSICYNQKIGTRLQLEGDCSKYIQCEGNSEVILSCTKGFIFNPDLDNCVPLQFYECPWVV